MDNTPLKRIELVGQVAIVTGGGRGIGRAIAVSLAAAGASVAVVARSPDQIAQTCEQIENAGGRSIAVSADVSRPEDVERMVRSVERTLGPADLLVNNAGLSGPFGPSWEADPDEWWKCLEVNLRGPWLCSQAVLPGMVARRRGRIVNVASGAGTRAIPHLSAYVVSKTAVIRLTEVMAMEVADHGVKVFAIEPGTVRTAMAEGALASEEGRRWMPWFGAIFEQGLDVPPERAAGLVLRLASGRADALSGRFLTVHDNIPWLVEQVERDVTGERHTLRLTP
jgi:NAD(P)-dependent dehydrogenase (short-subunit alcohol dehydrogenase family)